MGFVMFSTSKLITCFIVGFTSKRISHLIAYLLNESDHIWKRSALDMTIYMSTQGWGGWDFGFFGAVPTRRPNEWNAHWGYLETPDESCLM